MRASCLAGSALALAAATPLAAQTTSPFGTPAPYAGPRYVQPLSDADLLANEVRALAANPLDLNALVRAGELALKIDDPTAAAAFFARAERLDPRNPRVKAGAGSLLVAAERPGEALRRFAEAEALGGDPRGFAADRGLAYDLIGEQDRAQRDYRLALRGGSNDETLRRYALSLGISGRRELALAQIEPLLRRSDRGAWRARAFILAMNGDRPGAERIATTMMPSGMGTGLQPFFDILPTLRPADRAFAVHFGEIRVTPERAFDARLVPPLAALAPDPSAPVDVAATKKIQVVATVKPTRKSRKQRKREALAAATTPPPVPIPAPPAYAGQAAATPVALASNTVRLATPVFAAPPVPKVSPIARPLPRPVPVVTVPMPSAPVAPAPRVVASASAVPAASAAAATGSSVARDAAAPVVATSPPAMATVSVPILAPAPVAIAASSPTPPVTITPTPVRSEESILAAIIADIKIPGSELVAAPDDDATPAAAPAPAPTPTPTPTPTLTPRVALVTPTPKPTKALADKKAIDKKTTDKKALADKKAVEAKKLADAKKAAEDKRKKDPKFLEPSRVWVQVAGGANENDLPKQWAKLRTKAPAAFKGKQGWTTPLRATNRILAGPFKSDDEAQSFVNTAAKEGIAGFVFVSDAGQKIARLPAK